MRLETRKKSPKLQNSEFLQSGTCGEQLAKECFDIRYHGLNYKKYGKYEHLINY